MAIKPTRSENLQRYSQQLTFTAQEILTIVTLKKVVITFLFKVSKDLKNGFADTFENQKTN